MNELWICCQLGAREHYAIPRALHSQGRLARLITDVWLPPQHPLNWLPYDWGRQLRDRYHPELANASVTSGTNSQVIWELRQKFSTSEPWHTIMARNTWWQQQVLKHLATIKHQEIILFAYSYAARQLLQYAKQRGWQTILGQIDPGIAEQELVLATAKQRNHDLAQLSLPPEQYWSDWRVECQLADRIMVNSPWSAQALTKTGINPQKIVTTPLALEPQASSQTWQRNYPPFFSKSRPLRVLFLGQVILRKGVFAILEAIKLLPEQNWELWLVGSVQIEVPQADQNHPQIKWMGAVSRSSTNYYYQQADVFLLPTISDGFALTQLEAQAWQLPLIVSAYCGAVVQDQVNGLLLPEVTGEAIANAINFCLSHPVQLQQFANNSRENLAKFNVTALANNLLKIPQNALISAGGY